MFSYLAWSNVTLNDLPMVSRTSVAWVVLMLSVLDAFTYPSGTIAQVRFSVLEQTTPVLIRAALDDDSVMGPVCLKQSAEAASAETLQ